MTSHKDDDEQPKSEREKAGESPGSASRNPMSFRAVAANAESMSMHQWLDTLRGIHEETFREGDAASGGACLLTNPHTGATFCVPTSPEACAHMKGTFLGGPCGGIEKKT